MDNYLTGRNKDSKTNLDGTISEFRSLTDMANNSAQLIQDQNKEANDVEVERETVYSEGDSPVVEVLSVDGCPQEIIIHMNDGRVLKIACNY
ncbi:MAG: hypothetical protein CMI24_07035 [Opitutae bacterium]|nr:hypothetical protein [Opitutae bacterium]MEC8419655.1 hypothetical protein [Verrucomicrobiota bacterium]|tara:strand:- start:142 stop:417 length:276 start_codon:yes stop_codon:yes gene_type:complete